MVYLIILETFDFCKLVKITTLNSGCVFYIPRTNGYFELNLKLYMVCRIYDTRNYETLNQ